MFLGVCWECWDFARIFRVFLEFVRNSLGFVRIL